MTGSEPQFRRIWGRRLAVCLVASVALVASACGSAGADAASDEPHAATDEPHAATDTGQIVSILRGLGASMDYEPHDSPGELASVATLTVVGEVTSVDDGRVFGAGPTRDTEPVFLNTTLTVDADRVLAGDASLVRDGIVYVEPARPKETTVASVRSAIPADQQVVLFLDDYTEGLGTFPLMEESPPIPDGATVFAPYADGFLLEDRTTGEVVGGFVPLAEMAPQWRQGADSVEDFTATHFPSA